MPRILVLSASAGAGHNRAAEAIHESARRFCPGVESTWLDSLKFTNRLFSRLYEKSYVWAATHAPDVYGFIYKKSARSSERKRLDKAIELHDRLAYRKLMARVEAFRPDAIVCTHFLPATVLLAKKIGVPVYVVVTDFDAHPLWLNRKAAGYFVASDEVKVQLARLGYPPARIRVTGIPIHPVFADPPKPRRSSDRPALLFMSGGFGMGQMATVLERLLEIRTPYHLAVIAGKNEKMRARLQSIARRRAQVHGFVTNVQEFMAASDLIITKAGGLTVSECLARALPMIIFAPIPGQEECNADYLLERGVAVKARSIDVLDYKVLELLENPSRLDMMKRAAATIARPHAGRDVLRHVLDENPARR